MQTSINKELLNLGALVLFKEKYYLHNYTSEALPLLFLYSTKSKYNIINIIIIITNIYIVHMPDGKINRQIESEAHKKVDITHV